MDIWISNIWFVKVFSGGNSVTFSSFPFLWWDNLKGQNHWFISPYMLFLNTLGQSVFSAIMSTHSTLHFANSGIRASVVWGIYKRNTRELTSVKDLKAPIWTDPNGSTVQDIICWQALGNQHIHGERADPRSLPCIRQGPLYSVNA